MLKLKYLVAAAVLLLVAGAWTSAIAQIESDADTIKILDAYGEPGDTVAVDVYIANSIEVGGLNFLLKFDSAQVAPGYAWGAIALGDTTAPLHWDLINRGIGKFIYAKEVNSIDTSATLGHIVTGVFIGSPNSPDDIAVGSGTFLRFYVYIHEDAIEGDSVAIIPYDEPIAGGRINEWFDPDGVESRYPHKVQGWVHIGTPPPPEKNYPPFFTQPSATVYNIDHGQSVQFVVGVSDQNSGQRVDLTMTSGPPGASFSSATGYPNASSTFSWTPTLSQTGNFTASFLAEDDSAATATLTVSINVATAPIEDDLLYTTSQAAYRGIAGGIPGVNDVSVPINLIDLNTLYGVQFDVTYDYSVMSLDSIAQTDRLDGFELYAEVVAPGVTRVITFHLDGNSIGSAVTSDAIFNCWFTMKTTAPPGYYVFKLSDGIAALSSDPEQPSVKIDVDTLGAVAVDAIGDVNLDTYINVADLVTIVGYIIGNTNLSIRNTRAGDVNTDDNVNVVDLVGIINMIFTGGSPAPMQKSVFAGGEAALDLVMSGDGSGNTRIMALNADLPTDVAGIQLDLKYDPRAVELGHPERTSKTSGFDLKVNDLGSGRLRVLMYVDPDDLENTVRSGIGDLLTIPVYSADGSAVAGDAVTIESSVLSDPSAREIPVTNKSAQLPRTFTLEQNYPNPFNPETRISFAIGGQRMQSVRLEVYNILGQRVATLVNSELGPGSYDVTWDGTNSSGEKQASGVYFYNIVVGDSRETKKMVLAK